MAAQAVPPALAFAKAALNNRFIVLITRQFFRIGLAGLPAGWLLLVSVVIAADDPVHWKTGPALRRQLDEAVGITCRMVPFAKASIVCRRLVAWPFFSIAGSIPTTGHRHGPRSAAEDVLRQVASEVHAGIALVAQSSISARRRRARSLQRSPLFARHDVAKMPNERKRRLLQSGAWQWDELAQPGQLLEELARQAGVTVENANAIPLDLWPAVNLPSLAWTDRLTLLLAGFGLTFEIDERRPRCGWSRSRLQPSLKAVHAPRQRDRAGNATSARHARGDDQLEQGQLMVAARQEDHDKIERLLSGKA